MAFSTRTSPATLRTSFSFYLPARNLQRVEAVSRDADAIVLYGDAGPKIVKELRQHDWQVPVLFDRGGYNASESVGKPEKWFEAQAEGGADRLLSPGRWIGWTKDIQLFERVMEEETRERYRSSGVPANRACQRRQTTGHLVG